MSYIYKSVLVAFALILSVGSSNAATTDGQDGYISRACGFDNDKDGDYGESGECDYCDGTGVTQDPDGDTANEDEIYVNCQTGADNAGCGASTVPCKSIEYALTKTTTGSSYGGAEEDIICVAGTCGSYNGGLTPGNTSITITQDGLATTSTRNANVGPETGNAEEYNYEYPDDPFMIIGWDTDNDGSYPPHDTDQPYPAILDGCANANQLDTCTTNSGNSLFQLAQSDKFEMAHLTIANVGVVPVGNGTLTSITALSWSGSYAPDHHRIHDIKLYRNLLNVPNYTNHRTLSFSMSGGQSSSWIALENIFMEKNGGWPLRGWTGANAQARGTKLRFKGVTLLNHDNGHTVQTGPSGGQTLPVKWWTANDTEIIDNLFADPDQSGNSQEAVYPSLATNNTIIRSNTFKNYSRPVRSNHRDSDSVNIPTTTSHLSDGLFIDRNYFYWTSGFGSYGSSVIDIGANATNGQERTECPADACSGTAEACGQTGGAGANQDCDCNTNPMYRTNVQITNNIIDATNFPSVDFGIAYQIGDNCHNTAESNFGPVVIANNTFKNWNLNASDTSGSPRGAIVVGRSATQNWDYKFVKNDATVANNLILGLTNDRAVHNIKVGSNGCGPTTGTTCTAAGNYGTGDWFAANNVYQGGGVSYLRGDDCSVDADCAGTGTCDGGDRCIYSTLAAWQSVTNQDSGSKTCTPTFDSSGFRLATGDTCAKNAGSNTYCTAKDFDGEARSDGNCDIGADEVGGGGSPEGTVQLTNTTYTVDESGSSITISVSRAGGATSAASVQYSVSNGTATGGASCTGSADFISSSGTLNWGIGDSANKPIPITICEDATIEQNETVLVQIFDASTAGIGTPSSAILTIVNNDVQAGDVPTIDTVNVKSMCSQTDGLTATIPATTVVGGASRVNRALLVLVGAEAAYNDGDPFCDLADAGVSVVWNSQTLTRLSSTKGINGISVGICSGIFYLLNPTPATSSIVITFANTVQDVQALAIPLYNVAQQTPLSFDAASTGSGQAGSPINTGVITVQPDTLLLDVLALGERVGGGNIVPGGGQTELADISCGTGGSHTGISSKQAPNTGTNAMSWSWVLESGETSAFRYAHVIASLLYDNTVDTGTTTTTVPVTTTLPTDPTAPTIGHICILPCVENQ